LIAALGSYLQARAQNGIWRVRIEDIDPPREVPGAASTILRQLEHYGLHWDGEVLWQSQRHEAYRERLAWLHEQGLCYYCTCTRARIHAVGGVYDGHCRDLRLGANDAALRLRQTRPVLAFYDRLRGTLVADERWRGKISLSTAATVCSPIIWRWWWTIISRGSAKSSAGRILSNRRCARFRCISILAGRLRTMSICRWQ
jgi:glutamyl/glutaminyl-tRNA synthetase